MSAGRDSRLIGPRPDIMRLSPAWDLGGWPAHGLVRSSRATESSKVSVPRGL